MTLVAQFYENGRGARRVLSGRGATLRDPVTRPIDIVIDDLSLTGFGMSTTEDMSVGSIFHLRLAGIDKRDVRVVRRFGLSYGCEFMPPLSDAELALALSTGLVVDASFALDKDMPFKSAGVGNGGAKIPPLFRVGIVIGALAMLWVTIVLAVHVLVVNR